MIGLEIFLPVVLEENAKLKECSICYLTKSIDNFTKSATGKDGMRSYCKDCRKNQDLIKIKRYEAERIPVISKTCGICVIEKPIEEFNKSKASKDGFQYICKICNGEKGRKNTAKNKKLNSTKQIIPVTEKQCCKCRILKSSKSFSKDTARPDGLTPECKACLSISRRKTHIKRLNKVRERQKYRMENDLEYKIYCQEVSTQGQRMRGALAKRTERTMTLLGISAKDYIVYLESLFEPGMNWENHGILWHRDHIIPRTIFNLQLPEHRKIFFNYKNTMPRWKTNKIAKEYGSGQLGNIEKSDQILPEFEYLLAEYDLK